MPGIRSVTPHIPSADPMLTRDFFVAVFGFDVRLEKPEFIELEAGAYLIGIQLADGPPNPQSIYIQVEGIDDLWEAKRAALFPLEHRPPFEQDYGMKEFHVVAPGTRTLVFVGESVESIRARPGS
jgi:hypothetical protein